MANERTENEIIELARTFLQQQSAGRRAVQSGNGILEIVEKLDGISVVADSKNGFAVITNDDSQIPVMGYSFSTYDKDNVPEGFLWWLDAVSDAVTNGIVMNAYAVPSQYKSSVDPLIKTTWNQNNPFNTQCPIKSGEHCPTGCVATAMAQVLYYYHYPLQGSGSHNGFDFANTIFEWGNMLHHYDKWTMMQGKAVATLMYACGKGVNMNYALDGSSASLSDAAYALKNYFGYDDPQYYQRDTYTGDWMSAIYNELSNNRPVIYNGKASSGDGHVFILDGYDASGNFHVNWGWGGHYDGYFNLNNLKPNNKNYSDKGQGMLINIRNYVAHAELMSNLITISGSRKTNTSHSITFNITNHGKAFSGQLYLFVSQSETNSGSLKTQKSVTIGTGVTTDVTMTYTPSSNGTYYLWLTADNAGKDVIGKICLTIGDDEQVINFKDKTAEMVCLEFFDTNGDNALSYKEAAAVTSININVFSDTEITSFDELQYFTSLTTIPEGAFAHCYKLKNLTLPNSLQTIGFAAFSNCCSLQTISFPGSLTTISDEAFADCDGLKSMTLPNSLRTIGESAFYACESLKTLTLPEGLTKVGESAFEGCEALTTITLPSTLRSIGYNAFAFSGSAMKVHSSIKSPFAIDAFDYDEDAILYVPVGTKSKYENTDGWGDIFGTIIEEGGSASDAVTITANSYSRVYGEANPTFGYTVTSGTITSGTPTITCSATATSPVGTYDIVISKGSVSNGTVNLVNGKLTITKAPLTISAGNYTKKQGEDNPTFTPSFSGFKNGETKSVLTKQPTITTTATKNSPVGTYPVTVSGAEAQNYSFTYVNGTLTITANSTPSDNITFADAEVKRLCIAKWDTNGDGELSKTEAAAVTNLGTVFKNNKTIKSFNELQYFTGLKAIGEQAFYGCSGLTSVTIPNSVTSIGGYAFSGCSGLTSLTIPNSVTSIGVRTFESCSGLTSIVVNSGNTVYDSRGGCNAIIQTSSNELIAGCKNTVIPNSVTSIGWFAFYGCSGLTSVTIPNSVTKIGTCAFKNCSSLTSVIIPNSVTSIGSDAFFNCKSIQEVKSYITVPFSINDNVFQYSDNGSTMFTSATLYVPKGTKAKYQTTDGWKNFTKIVELEGLSIDGINSDEMDDDGYYTLDGRKVDGMPTTKGIYIKRGRKVLIP